MRYKLVFTFFFLFTNLCVNQLLAKEPNTKIWEPALGNKQIPIWPDGKMPDTLDEIKPESIKIRTDQQVAGKPWIDISDVSKPTIQFTLQKQRIQNQQLLYFLAEVLMAWPLILKVLKFVTGLLQRE